MEAIINSDPTMELNNNEKLGPEVQEKEVEDAGGGEELSDNIVNISPPTSITVTDPEEWLCVAKLPLDITEDEFWDLLAEFGGVKESFLMKSKRTGVFKGYGFACFQSKVAALQARHVLEGQEVRGHSIDCGWIKEGTHQLADLHSKVIYVDLLPTGFRDLAQFRKMFARIVTPPYCQIAQKNGVIQEWGLVEYNSAEEAETTMDALHDATLDDTKIRVQYCIPNIHAINIYMSFVNNPLDNRVEKKALMDDCPSKDVYSQLQSLSKQNPWFVQSLQSIMTQNILAEDCLPHLPPIPEASDPQISNQAVLALLLAAYLKPQHGLQQGTASLSSLIKQLESGTSAIDLLKNALVPLATQTPLVQSSQQSDSLQNSANRSPLLPSPPGDRPTLLVTPGSQPLLPTPPSPAGQAKDLSTLISSMTAMVGAGKLPTQPPASVTPNTKNPQLMNMLYSAFQARVSKQQGETDAVSPPPNSEKDSPPPFGVVQGNDSASTLAVATNNNIPNHYSVTQCYPGTIPSYALTPGYPPHQYTIHPQYQSAVPPPNCTSMPHPSQPLLNTPTSSQSKNLNQILSLPPPPPPPSPYSTQIPHDPGLAQGWQFNPAHMVPPPGQGLLFSPMMAQPLWSPGGLYMPPGAQKRKGPEYLPQPTYAEIDNQAFKRQKLCGGN
eukprot:TRINITY_DN46070_c0_g1_i1.p1 TRINITY_DN46070_c0_g1~~TRINITY_DN46070_c0_g1_i1.p1  ORF type:complete len:666 (-),score=138.11 TRINITY_DN46070_c0_g1_i1:710-2707(-)